MKEKERERERKRERERDRQTDRQRDRQTDRQTDRALNIVSKPKHSSSSSCSTTRAELSSHHGPTKRLSADCQPPCLMMPKVSSISCVQLLIRSVPNPTSMNHYGVSCILCPFR
ncbi:hypothetical protein BsWGS_27998 [Bradybaena similaris]